MELEELDLDLEKMEIGENKNWGKWKLEKKLIVEI